MSNEYSASDYLKLIIELAPTIQKLIPIDCSIAVADTEKFICSISGEKIKMPDSVVGKPLPKGDGLYNAIRDGRFEKTMITEEAFGFAFESCAVPLKDNRGNIVGGLAVGYSIENREDLMNNAEAVAASSQQAYGTIEELAAAASQLATQQLALQTLSQEITNQINDTKSIVEFIQGVAKTSNLLALNASIESARAGEAGRGFSVVAKEMRKMAENSANGIKEIENVLSSIRTKVQQIAEKISESVAISEEQAASTEEISSNMHELAISSDKLKNASTKVIG